MKIKISLILRFLTQLLKLNQTGNRFKIGLSFEYQIGAITKMNVWTIAFHLSSFRVYYTTQQRALC